MTLEDCIKGFIEATKKSHEYTLSGEWKKGNAETAKINDIYSKIKAEGSKGMDELLKLTDSEDAHIALAAAVHCMRYAPEKCLATLERLVPLSIPLVSSHAKYSIMNWKSGEWYID